MLARSRKLHLGDSELTSPLLVPAVSSKGFPLVNGLTEAGLVLTLVSPDMTEALLISAYDLHHQLLPEYDEFLGPNHYQTVYGTASLIVVDSGGYELSNTFEGGDLHKGPWQPQPFDRPDYEAVVERLPSRNLLVVTYDRPDVDRPGYEEQRKVAQQFATARPELKIDFLLKPPAGKRFIVPSQLAPEVANLRNFDVIGVTEKELGDSLMERLLCLARLRRLLDTSECAQVPLHIFGGLDPLLTPLYFLAGGEIFDGLSWLRYAYHDDVALHREELAVLTAAVDAPEVRRDALRHISNLQQLRRFKHALERWSNEPKRYELLGRHHEKIREIHELLQARL